MNDQNDDDIVHRVLDTDDRDPSSQIPEIVAELEGKRNEELTTTYDHLDHVLDHIFSNPPAPEAQVTITFSYESYRITVEQNGNAQFVKL